MSNKNRGDRLQLLHKVAKKYYKPVNVTEGRSILENLLYACCLEDARYESADEAYHRLQGSYFDWNEVRVTTVTELSEVLHNLPDPSAAAIRVKRNLQSIFETRYSFDVEDLAKMNQGKAIQELEKLGGISKFVLAYTIQNSLGGHAIPISQSISNLLIATGIVTEAEAAKGQAPGLERTIAKSKGHEFFSCVHQFALDCKLQPNSKQIKAMLKEAGAVERPKEPPKPAPAPKPEPKVEAKPEAVPASKPKKKPVVAVQEKETPKKIVPAEKPAKAEKAVEKSSKPGKSAVDTKGSKADKPTTKGPVKPANKSARPAKKAPAKKQLPAPKTSGKKKTDKIKRKPK
jgi:endonuclease III